MPTIAEQQNVSTLDWIPLQAHKRDGILVTKDSTSFNGFSNENGKLRRERLDTAIGGTIIFQPYLLSGRFHDEVGAESRRVPQIDLFSLDIEAFFPIF
jgi:hypothetical protein